MPYHPHSSDATEFDGLPRRLPDQQAVLIGRVVDNNEYTGLVAYYIHGRGSVLLGSYSNHEFRPEYTIACDSRLMSACARAFQTVGVETELSSIGSALVQAWQFGEMTGLSHKQAHVYAFREKAGFARDETAAMLNISPSTVDTHLQRARDKLVAAANLVRLDRADSEELIDTAPDGVDGLFAEDTPSTNDDIMGIL